MQITVKDTSVLTQPITVYSQCDGYIETCNHAGAVEQDVTEYRYDASSGDYEEYNVCVICCDKCDKQLVGEEWL